LLNTLQNSTYLACSWLWCLGGFFPLILLRDYGWPAIAAFTIFNIGGAIAMAYYFKNPSQQLYFIGKHYSAITSFSFITIAYQLFFVSWLGAVIGQPLLPAIVISIAFAIYLSKGAITHWAVAIYLVSIALFISFVVGVSNGVEHDFWPVLDASAKIHWPHTVLPLAIGFILSPYLDITFHRAYKHSAHPKTSFTLGFGIFFLSLLAFVFLYADSLSALFFSNALPNAIIYPVIAFLVLQTAFTIAAHCRELATQGSVKPHILATSIIVFTLIVLASVYFVHGSLIAWVNLPLEETLYKSFLFFYSLVFPLYLLMGTSKPFYLWVLAIATPAYSLGFLVGGDYSFSLTVGVVIIVFALLIFKRRAYINEV
jgi:hypothetical protein